MFDANFLWGCATAGRQVERPSGTADWDVFVGTPAITKRVHDFQQNATGTSVNYTDPLDSLSHEKIDVLRIDLDRLVALGANAYRFSVEWDRIQPTDPMSADAGLGPAFDDRWQDFYVQVVREIIGRRMTPVISLNHMSLPKWVLTPPSATRLVSPFGIPYLPVAAVDDQWHASLQGWETDPTVVAFVGFVKRFAQAVKDALPEAKPVWLTLNEPIGSMVGAGYLGALWCPGFGGEADRGSRVCHHLLKAHVLAYRALKVIDGEWQVGFAHAMLHATPTSASSVLAGAEEGGAIGGAIGAAGGAAGGALVGALIGAMILGPLGAIIGAVVGAIVGAIEGAAGAAAVGAAVGAVVAGAQNVQQRSTDQFDYFYNEWMLRALIRGEVDTDLTVGTMRTATEWDDAWTTTMGAAAGARGRYLDFVGLNYYRQVHVYYSPLASLYVPYTGGVFNNNMEGDADPHGVLNELGWEVFPAGLSMFLLRIKRDYDVPVLVTENGTPEALDANRAASLIAHVDEISLALADAMPPDVLGYIHWSSVSNWEWHEDYRASARFGLYCVDGDRTSAANRVLVGPTSTPRRQLTEAGIAFRSVIEDPDSGGARARFGAIASAGERVDEPILTHGALWKGQLDGVAVKLFLDTRSGAQTLTGLLYYAAENLWLRLRAAAWDDGRRELSFSVDAHTLPAIPARSVTVTLDQAAVALAGQTRQPGSGAIGGCNLSRVTAHGLWLPTGAVGAWKALAMHEFFDSGVITKWLAPGNGQRWEANRAAGGNPLTIALGPLTVRLTLGGPDLRDLTVAQSVGGATFTQGPSFRRAPSSLHILAET